MEQFDLVDINDQIIGTTDKPTAHATRQIHRVVAVYVFNTSGELYVQIHKSGGLYDHSVGGHVSKGEDYASAARREAQEELGIDQPLDYLLTFFSDEGIYHHMFAVYECVADANWSFVPNDEVAEIVPMSLKTIQDLMATAPEKFTTGFINTMAEFGRIKKQTTS